MNKAWCHVELRTWHAAWQNCSRSCAVQFGFVESAFARPHTASHTSSHVTSSHHSFFILVTTSEALVTTSKAPVTTSVALVTNSFLLLLVRHLLLERVLFGIMFSSFYSWVAVRPLRPSSASTHQLSFLFRSLCVSSCHKHTNSTCGFIQSSNLQDFYASGNWLVTASTRILNAPAPISESYAFCGHSLSIHRG